VSARVGDTGVLIVVSITNLQSPPAGWSTVFSNTSSDPRIMVATKSLDSGDISAGQIAVTPVTGTAANNQTGMTLVVLRGESKLKSNNFTRSTFATGANGNGDDCPLSSTEVTQFQMAVRAYWGNSNRTIAFAQPVLVNALTNVSGTGTGNVGIAAGYFPFAVASRTIDMDISGTISNGLFLNLLWEPPVPEFRAFRPKRAVNRASIARSVR
jgi:hypothetical protein